MKTMHFFVRTNATGSECNADLDVTKKQWNAMSEQEQLDLINEYRADVMDSWVEEREQEHV
jgi:2-polyprenyl-3-methyl-5-hydroxy-6-metoxy-1,4-benzoquinol methylase